ncbi:hypothetical protein [Bradyrhizobium sp. NBAIM01]|uniref:hypothetical protein n=1 Tax=Bradyrhizobium sp. NBAIM01 TaxID=2793818 RepID=UPI001CD3E930|nr:hypothetical protein [Bradyrhizobium sp. NBAIM01]MCA1510371.1 hypothetical protein [Bradyrhizobium sp. NBAIM01]
MLFDRVLVAALMPAWPLLEGEEKPAIATQVLASVTLAIADAPLHIRLVARSVAIVLGVCIFLISVGAEGSLASSRRAERFCTFLERSPGPIRSVMRLYRSMVLLAFYEQALVAAKLLSARATLEQNA